MSSPATINQSALIPDRKNQRYIRERAVLEASRLSNTRLGNTAATKEDAELSEHPKIDSLEPVLQILERVIPNFEHVIPDIEKNIIRIDNDFKYLTKAFESFNLTEKTSEDFENLTKAFETFDLKTKSSFEYLKKDTKKVCDFFNEYFIIPQRNKSNDQHYPPGTQDFTEGLGEGNGEPGVPPKGYVDSTHEPKGGTRKRSYILSRKRSKKYKYYKKNRTMKRKSKR
jgi:hypothetical protein